jgi:transposase
VRLSRRVWPLHHRLQPLQPLVPSAVLGRAAGSAGHRRGGHQEHGDRLHLCQGAALGLWRKRGARTQAIGPSRGGQTTKVHALTDTVGRPYALTLTPGNVSDITVAPALLEQAKGARHVLADKGYDADDLRRRLRQVRAAPVIPGRANRRHKPVLDKARYKERHLIENAFCRLKDWRRVATRYDKLAANFLSGVVLATLVAFWL